jgi:hypothetical protein
MFKSILFTVLSFINFTGFSQEIARQTLSNQGTTKVLQTGQVISQTIGQNSIIGSFYDTKGVQGFQQPIYYKRSELPANLTSKLVVYPNPFVEIIKVNVPDVVDNTPFQLQVFDSSGRIVFLQDQLLEKSTLSINLKDLPTANYILLISGRGLKFSANILKQ